MKWDIISEWFHAIYLYFFTKGFSDFSSFLVVVLLIKLITLPIAIFPYIHRLRMSRIKGLEDNLKMQFDLNTEKYEYNKALRKLHKENGIHFFRLGCLPIIIQIIIIIFSIHFFYFNDIKTIKYGWFELGEKDGFYILPILASTLAILESAVTHLLDRKKMNWLEYILTILNVIICFLFINSVLIFWIVSSIITIIQAIILKIIRIQENKEVIKIKHKVKTFLK